MIRVQYENKKAASSVRRQEMGKSARHSTMPAVWVAPAHTGYGVNGRI